MSDWIDNAVDESCQHISDCYDATFTGSAKLERIIRSHAPKTEWRPIEEGDKDGNVRTVNGGGSDVKARWSRSSKSWWYAFGHGELLQQPTHIFDIPAPPQTPQEGSRKL